jgi:hypothetical protein
MKTAGIKLALWAFLPLLSAIAVFFIFRHFATHTEMNAFDWREVKTNILLNATSALPTTNSNVSSTSVSPPSLQSHVAAPSSASRQQRGGFQTGSDSSTASSNTGTNSVSVKSKQAADRLTKELCLRMFWAVSAVVFAVLCFAVVVYSIQIINEVLRPSLTVSVGLVLGAAASFGILLYVSRGPISAISGGEAAEQLFKIILNDTSDEGGVLNKELRAERVPVLRDVRNLVTFISAASKLGLGAVAIAGCCVLMTTRKEQDGFAKLSSPSPDDIAKAKEKYERRAEITVSLLQLTACALVSSVVQVYLLYYMASYYVDQKLQTDIQYFAQGLATVSGFVYSGLLIAVYLPLVAGQKAIGRELIRSHGGNKVSSQDTVFLAQLDAVDPKKAPIVTAIITVFSPVLAAFLAKLASSLMEHL